MIAHRGVSGIECENSCPAFVLAGSRSYYGIETDVHITRDGKFLICHDSNISRVAGGVNMEIEECDYDDLRKVPLVSPNMGERRTDLYLPALEDYISICKKYDKESILEIKTDFSVEDIEKMAAVIDEIGHGDKVTYISFSRVAMENLRKVLPGAKAQYLTCDANGETLEFLDKYNFDLDILYSSLTPEYVNLVHDHGHKINVWTVDSLDTARRMQELGVDYITSNILE